ncbi:MAG: cytochrome c oxidase subunit II [Planctomycetota bacterium]
MKIVTLQGGGLWFPEGTSQGASAVDELFFLILGISGFFFVLIVASMVFFALRYGQRRRPQPERSPAHNLALELAWSVLPAVLLGYMFVEGYRSYLELRTPPDDAYEIQAIAQRWSWSFIYPNGHVSGELHVPVDRPVEVVLTSEDVIHSFFVRAFRVKMDAVPGRYSKAWFVAERPGSYEVQCAEYCGTGHSAMNAALVVHPPGGFEAWLEEASNLLDRLPPVEAGKELYHQRGCVQCHSVDGSPRSGPTFLGLYGSQRELESGERVLADENYVRESILAPQAKVARGWPPVMPTYKGRIKDGEIGAVIAYLKTLEGGNP